MNSEAEEGMSRRRKAALIATTAVMVAAAIGIALWGNVTAGKPPAAQQEPGSKPLLTEFGDFQCPHCARFNLVILPALDKEFIRDGHIRFEYRHYPFLGQGSQDAAEAAECAREQNAFRKYHDEVYRLAAGGKTYERENLLEAARETQLDEEAFLGCVSSGRTRSRVTADWEYGQALGVRGTPSLFLNGQEIRWRNYIDLREQIQAAVEEARNAERSSGT